MDQESLIERLTAENEEFRRLRSEHRAHDQELEALKGMIPLSAESQWRVSELKKLKLMAKDRMEALTAAAVAALTVYDMVKAVERGVTIAKVQLVEKLGGKSGHWRR